LEPRLARMVELVAEHADLEPIERHRRQHHG